MRWIVATGVIIILLLVNRLTSWDYAQGRENLNPVNDSVRVRAGKGYSRMTALKYMFLGENYRTEWSVAVPMPVFHLDTTLGGFEIVREGGGEQTRKLHLLSRATGQRWELRSVDKDVTFAVPERYRKTLIQDLVQDGISGAYPYALLTICDLSRAVGVPAAPSFLFFVPGDPALGKYQNDFANTVCFLMPDTITGTRDSRGTDSLIAAMQDGHAVRIRQENVLKSRLLDMVIADWDRHNKQWQWVRDTTADSSFYPVPEDRDQAYFLAGGIIPFMVRILGMPHLCGFKYHLRSLNALNTKAHSFDGYFMNALDRGDWTRIVRSFQADLSDEAIHRAILRLPAPVYEISGHILEEKLKSRRNALLKYGLEYYRFLAGDVKVVCQGTPEHIEVRRGTGKTIVRISEKTTGKLLYQRSFLPEETGKITLTNVSLADSVTMSGKGKSGLPDVIVIPKT